MQRLSTAGLRLIEKWEELVPYVYDDKVPKRRINGRMVYPEWDGGPVRGTLTIGYGHTNAAGYPTIKQGMTITSAQADEILDADLGPVMASVRSTVKVPLTQHQFDTLVSFTFNCGAGNLRKLCALLNKGDYDSIPRKLMQYVTSKGERMRGLVNRRAAEVALWNLPDDPQEAEATEVFSPKATRDDPPKPISESKTANASIGVGAGGATVILATANDVGTQIRNLHETAQGLGITDLLMPLLHSPMFWVGLALVGAAAFIYWDRRRKLLEEHV